MFKKSYSLSIALIIGWFCLCSSMLQAQELPPLSKYTPQQYNGENQNWSISQAEDKTIYVANNIGLLEFNGANWIRYNSPNETILRSVKVVGKKIYTGSYMDFGYWVKNNLGVLEYTSLSKSKAIDLIEGEQIWKITNLDDWILFRSLNRIYIYNPKDDSFRILDSKTSITKMFKVDNSIYYQDISHGIYKIVNGNQKLFLGHDIVKNNIVTNVFKHNQEFLFFTENKGIYSLQNNTFSSWNTPLNNKISKYSIYSCIQLKDGGFALGTISNGVVTLDKNGDLENEINQNLGLSNNTVLSLFEDVDNNIWLGLDNGINCINSKSPIKIYNDIKGNLGSVYTSAIVNENLYLGTNQGLFYKNINDKNSKFVFIDGTQGQVWFLEDIKGTLFCGHNTGTYVVEGNTVRKIAEAQGTWSIKEIPNHPDLLLQGNYDGLNILEKKNDTWNFRNKIEGFEISSRFFEIVNSTTVFISHEYKGVYKLLLDDEFLKVKNTDVKKVDKGLNSALLKYDSNIYYTYRKGAYKFDFSTNKFKKDTLLSGLFNTKNYASGKLINDRKNNILWGFTKNEIVYVRPGKLSKSPEINKIVLPVSLRNGVTSYENIININDNRYLLGTSSGYIIIDLDKFKNVPATVSLNQVSSNEFNKKSNRLSLNEVSELNSKENNLAFYYSVTQFDKYKVAEYQHKLEGMYSDWSSWKTTSSMLYKNLSPGDYTFKVRARIGNNISKNIEVYNFTINKPWYISSLAIVGYVLVSLTCFFLFFKFYNRHHIKQRKQIMLKAKQDLERKELENKQQQMHFKNQQLQQNIDNKSRELAISTMSLVKKNEFLNTIKKELKSISSNKEITSVIKIIDKNLNNTDDWHFFQEAFNNADKDFLKKLKSKHSKLTPNDLKLCAYLRLNLSSKEIAPLLNISPRSVEVKRYRLRKKMDLPHETSLANHIIEL